MSFDTISYLYVPKSVFLIDWEPSIVRHTQLLTKNQCFPLNAVCSFFNAMNKCTPSDKLRYIVYCKFQPKVLLVV